MQFNKFDFRVWHTKKRAFIDNLGFTSKYHAEIALLQDNGKWQTYNDTHLLEIELWSGFYDVNNKKIYEGDIVQYKGQNRVCVYECATFYLIEPLIEKEFQVDCGTRLQRLYETGSLSNTEVIGNICENLNLIKGANHEKTEIKKGDIWKVKSGIEYEIRDYDDTRVKLRKHSANIDTKSDDYLFWISLKYFKRDFVKVVK